MLVLSTVIVVKLNTSGNVVNNLGCFRKWIKIGIFFPLKPFIKDIVNQTWQNLVLKWCFPCLGSSSKRWKNWKIKVGTWKKRCWNPEAEKCDCSVRGLYIFSVVN